MNDTVRLGRIRGIAVGANWSLFALVAIVAYFLATSRLPSDAHGYSPSAYWLAGVVTAVALFAGVLAHEMAHAITAKRSHMKVDGITLWFMGGLTRIEGDGGGPRTELWTALVGPLTSLALGAGSLALSKGAGAAGWDLVRASLFWLGFINILLGVFNLIPASPLDGGRVLHGALWWVTKNRWLSTRVTAGAGSVLGMACLFGGLMSFESADAVDGFTLAAMGWFILSSAKREHLAGRAQHVLSEARVSDIMRPAVLAPGWLTVDAFWKEWVAPYPDSAFVLETWGGGRADAVVTAQQLAAVPPSMRASLRARDVALPLTSPDAPAGQMGAGADSYFSARAAAAAARARVSSTDWRKPLAPDQPALAVASRLGVAIPVEAYGAIVGVVLAPDVGTMINRGAPVGRRTWFSAPAWAGQVPFPSA
ncbi:MAG TPA: site-2 protease family protein [Acidimicrobiales bacterium]|nr:site-2 protease family protein [Acidimicrobiales bacterium]